MPLMSILTLTISDWLAVAELYTFHGHRSSPSYEICSWMPFSLKSNNDEPPKPLGQNVRLWKIMFLSLQKEMGAGEIPFQAQKMV